MAEIPDLRQKKSPRKARRITPNLRWVTVVTTLGFPVEAGLAHHCQGQSPNLMLVGLFFFAS